MNDRLLIALFFYLVLWGISAIFFWRAYRIIKKKELRLIKDITGVRLKNSGKIAKRYAVMEVISGGSLVVLAIAIPIFSIPMKIWPAFIIVIGTSQQLTLLKLQKESDA